VRPWCLSKSLQAPVVISIIQESTL
jgi:hypothetical protein